jgi:hypothetical protein
MKARTPMPAPKDDPAQRILKAFNIVTDMENDLEDVRSLAGGVAIIAIDAIHGDEPLSGFLMRIGRVIQDRVKPSRRGAASFSGCCTEISMVRHDRRPCRAGAVLSCPRW